MQPLSLPPGPKHPPAPHARLELVELLPAPLIHPAHPDAHDIRHGLEGGRVLRLDNAYHLFTSEMAGDPRNVRMRLAHWRSADGLAWTRVGTLRESSSDFTGADHRAALWSPMPIYDDTASRWNLFYVAYRCAPSHDGYRLMNFEGRIWRAVSTRPGPSGHGGPYADDHIVLQPGPEALARWWRVTGPPTAIEALPAPAEESDFWEGLQGTAAFFPYRAADRWLAFYGSAHARNPRATGPWLVGLAEAPALSGPWRRCTALNPSPINSVFIENPIITRLADDLWLAVFDTNRFDIAYATSTDGIRWSANDSISLAADAPPWLRAMRTPLGAIREDDGLLTVYFTAFDGPWDKGWGHLGRARLRLTRAPAIG